jgi:sensor domain CHASE-containing protein
MITKILRQNHAELQQKLFWIGSGLLVILAVFYCFSINTIVFEIAERKDTEANMHSLKSDIAEMELQYVALQNTVTLASAAPLGLSQVEHPIFISATKSLSIR